MSFPTITLSWIVSPLVLTSIASATAFESPWNPRVSRFLITVPHADDEPGVGSVVALDDDQPEGSPIDGHPAGGDLEVPGGEDHHRP